MISDVLKTIKNMCSEYRFEDWLYLIAAVCVIIFGLYSCTGMMTRADMTKEQLMMARQDYLEKKWNALDEMVEMKVE